MLHKPYRIHPCMSGNIHTYIHTYMHIHTHIYNHACMPTNKYTNMYRLMEVCTGTHAYIHACIYGDSCIPKMYIQTDTHVFPANMHACMHTYIHTYVTLEMLMNLMGSLRLQFIPHVLLHSKGLWCLPSGTGSDRCRVASYPANLQTTKTHQLKMPRITLSMYS